MSVEGEKIPFLERVNPAATGAVERWLLDVESAIRRTLHKVRHIARFMPSWLIHVGGAFPGTAKGFPGRFKRVPK